MAEKLPPSQKQPRSLTPEELVAFQEWAKKYAMAAKGECVFCKTNHWNVNPMLWEIRPFYDGASVLGGGPIAPLIMMICSTCGHVEFINALASKTMELGVQKEKDGTPS